LKRRRWFSA